MQTLGDQMQNMEEKLELLVELQHDHYNVLLAALGKLEKSPASSFLGQGSVH